MYIKMIIYVPCIFMYIHYLMVNIQGAFFFHGPVFLKLLPMALNCTGVTGQKNPQWVWQLQCPSCGINVIKSASC